MAGSVLKQVYRDWYEQGVFVILANAVPVYLGPRIRGDDETGEHQSQ
jgi:hypothetical protein